MVTIASLPLLLGSVSHGAIPPATPNIQGTWDMRGVVVRSEGTAKVGTVNHATWALRLIRTKGGTSTVEPIPVDAQGRATIKLGAGETGVLAVIGTTPFTTEPASYSYVVTTP